MGPKEIGIFIHVNISAMTRKKLPIGIQTFAKIREDDYCTSS